MADSRFIRLKLQGESIGKKINLKEICVWNQTKIALLKDYITEVLCYKGSLYLDKRMVYQSSTLAELKIEDGGTLKLNKYQILSRSSLRELQIFALPQGELFTVQVPARIKVQLLKFVIECERGIQIAHQVLRSKNKQRLDDDLHECSREELQMLTVEDICRKIHTPQKDSPKNWKSSDTKSFSAQCGPEEFDEASGGGDREQDTAVPIPRSMQQKFDEASGSGVKKQDAAIPNARSLYAQGNPTKQSDTMKRSQSMGKGDKCLDKNRGGR